MTLHRLLVSYKRKNNNHKVEMLHNVTRPTTRTALMQDHQAVCAPVGQQEEHVTSESQQEMPNLNLSLRKT